MKLQVDYSKLILIFYSIVCYSCTNNNANNKTKTIIVKTNYLELRLERGAFHYDNFELKDTLLTYYPDPEKIDTTGNKYTTFSKKSIQKHQIDSLIAYIQSKNVFNLKGTYSNMSSCDSGLFIRIRLNDKVKEIFCEDFIRGCPEEIRYLENVFIRWQGDNLKRKFLPG